MDLIDSETLYSLLRNKYVLLCGDSIMRSLVTFEKEKNNLNYETCTYSLSYCAYIMSGSKKGHI